MSTPHLSYGPQPATRPAPPTGNPPAYAKIYPYSLRPILLVSTLVSFFYLIILGIASLKAIGYTGETAKLKTFDGITGGLFIAAAAVEVFGFAAAWTQRIPMARLYSRISVLAFLAVMASELLSIVTHFTMKNEIINACTVRNTGRSVDVGGFWWGSGSDDTILNEAQAKDQCGDQWSKGSIWNIVWLIVTAILGLLFVAFSFAFVRQLLDPSSVRVAPRSVFNRQSGAGAPSQAYAQNQYYQQGPYDPSNQRYDPESNFSYPPPPGPPPARGAEPPIYDSRGRDSLEDRKNSSYGYVAYERDSLDGARPESSRRGVYRENSIDKGRESEETLRESNVKVKGGDDSDDGAPRV